jgi:hypothetical protein
MLIKLDIVIWNKYPWLYIHFNHGATNINLLSFSISYNKVHLSHIMNPCKDSLNFIRFRKCPRCIELILWVGNGRFVFKIPFLHFPTLCVFLWCRWFFHLPFPFPPSYYLLFCFVLFVTTPSRDVVFQFEKLKCTYYKFE